MNASKKLTFLGVAIAATILPASAQSTLVAGWDFSQFFTTGANSVNGADFAGAGVATANYSDLLAPDPAPSIAASAYGTIYYEGSFGSTDTAPAQFNADVAPASGNLTSLDIQAADGSPFNALSSYNLLEQSGQAFRQNLSLGVQVNAAIVFAADAGAMTGTGWSLSFAGLTTDGDNSSSVGWEVSTNGTDYLALGTTSNLNANDGGFTVSGGASLDGASQVYFRGTFAGVDTQALIDNVGISATVIPEPSMFTLLLGAFAGFVVLRRRR